MSASVLQFPLWRCPGCGHYLREPEVAHNRRCAKAQALARPAPKPKPKREPVPSLKARRRAALRQRLATQGPTMAITAAIVAGLEPDQLHRVAEGKSDFSPTTWKRLDPYLGVAP